MVSKASVSIEKLVYMHLTAIAVLYTFMANI